MAKVLKATFPQKCIGCELCIMEVQQQLGKVGIEGAPIRIFKKVNDYGIISEIEFTIELDSAVNSLDIQKIRSICPTDVFTIEEMKEEDALL